MKILSICGILPIPDLKEDENDIVFHTYDYYLEKYPSDEIDFILPVPYANYLMSKMGKKFYRRYKLKKIKNYTDRGYHITIFPYFIVLINLNQYTWMHKFLYQHNKEKIKKFADYDLIHAHRIFPEGYLAYKMSEKLSIPYVITVRKEERYFNGGKAEDIATEILDSASEITTLNSYSYNLLKPHYPDIHLLPHGVEERFFTDADKQSNRSQIKILTVARLLKLKNIEKVIFVLSKLKNEYNLKYQIVGNGPHRDAIKEYIDKYSMHDHVEMISHVDHEEIQNVYAGADIFTMISYPETFGRVYFEAMAAGLPIVCAENSGVHGFFEEEVSGFSVEHNNTQELQHVLEKLLRNETLRTEVGNKGRELVRNYSWPVVIEKYREIFREALKKAI